MRITSIGMHWAFSSHLLTRHNPTMIDHAAEGAMLADIRSAQRRVRQVVEHTARLGSDVICLPGSSMPIEGEVLPPWLHEAAKGRVIALETFTTGGNVKQSAYDSDAGNSRRGWLLVNGAVALGPLSQLVVKGTDAKKAPGQRLQSEILEGRRSVELDCGSAVLLICGEINVVEGGGPSPRLRWGSRDMRLWWESLPRPRIVLNPTHTRMGPQAPRDKRAWLSQDGAVLCPDNAAHETLSPRTGDRLWRTSKVAGYLVAGGEVTPTSRVPGVSLRVDEAMPAFATVVV